MADAPEIKVKLTAEDTGVAAAIKELGSNLKNLKKTQDSTAASSLNLAKAFQGLAAGAIAYKILAFGKSVFDAGVQIAKTAQITGASAATLGVFHKAAGDLSISSEAVDKGFVKLSRSILSFQQGSLLTVKAFQQLGITAKDFQGLNTDQKIKLITDRLGGMAAGTTKAALAQQLMGRGGAELIPVLNELAGEGFDKAKASAEKFGLLLDDKTAQSILAMKQSLADLGDEAQGAATQFEVGLIPALTSAAQALAESVGGAGVKNGFESLGEEAGSVIKAITFGFLSIGESIGSTVAEIEVEWDFAMNHMKDVAKSAWQAIKGYAKGGLGEAIAEGTASLTSTAAGKDFADQLIAIGKEHEAAQEKIYANVYGEHVAGKTPKLGTTPPDQTNDPGEAAAAKQSQTKLGLLRQHLEDELTLWRAHQAGVLESQKDAYDQGLLSTAQYFALRQADLKAATEKELAVLQKELAAEQAAAAANAAKVKALGIATPGGKAYESARAVNLKTIAQLQTQIAKAQIDGATKAKALDDEEFAKKKENQKALLDFQEQILEAEGKTYQAAVLKINQEADEMALALRKTGGNPADAEAFRRAKLGQAGFEEAAGDTGKGIQAFDVEKKGIEISTKSGKTGRLAAEREINELIKERIPLLQKQAQAELAAAKATGNMDDIAKAQNDVQAVQNLKVQTTSLAQQMRGPVSQSFTGFFETVGRGTETVQRSFENLARGIIDALQKVLLQKLMEKILGTDSSGSGSGGGGGLGSLFTGLLGAFGHHAEGGLIRGRGGPRSDSIPAMLSSGEYVVNAAAVEAFGAHNLEAINRGLRIESIRNLGIPRFAEGGLVGPGSSGEASNIHLAVGLDKGLVLQHLSSKSAGRVILQHIVNNPKAASKAMSRGT